MPYAIVLDEINISPEDDLNQMQKQKNFHIHLLQTCLALFLSYVHAQGVL